MYGNGIGTLQVVLLLGSIESESIPTASREVWSLTGEADNFWHQGQLSLSARISCIDMRNIQVLIKIPIQVLM